MKQRAKKLPLQVLLRTVRRGAKALGRGLSTVCDVH